MNLIKPSRAARLEILIDLISPRPVYDEDAQQIGEDPPVVEMSPETLLSLLEVPTK